MSGKLEKVLRRPQTPDKTRIPMEIRTPASPGDDAADPKGVAPAGSEPEDNSRILQLASIAQYRAKRRIAMAEKTREQLGPAFPDRKS